MNKADKQEIKEALKICESYAPDKCRMCPLGWLEDHFEDCQPVIAKMALELLEEQQREIDALREERK